MGRSQAALIAAVDAALRRPLRRGAERASAARRRRQAVDVGHDDALALEADQAIVGELAEELVHALPRAADHRGQVALGQVRAESDATVRLDRPALVREPDESGRKPAGDVEEMQLLDVRRQPPQLPGDRREQRVADTGLRRDQLAEAVAWQDDGLGRADRPSRSPTAAPRRAGRARRRRRRRAGSRGSLPRRSRMAARSSRRPRRSRTARHPDRRCGRSPRRVGTGAPASLAASRSRAAGSRPAKNGIAAKASRTGSADQHAGDGNRVEMPTHHSDRAPIACAAMTEPLGARLRLTVLGCSTAAPHPGHADGRIPRRVGLDGDPARLRPGRDPEPAEGARPARSVRDRDRPHARRPLPRHRRPALPVPVGRAVRPSRCRSTCRPAGARDSTRSRTP